MQNVMVVKEENFILKDIAERIEEEGLVRFASEAALDMDFSNMDELENAIRRSYNICIAAEIPIKGNFKRIYTCSPDGIICDWKLSVLAYNLVCLNGDSSSFKVAKMQVSLLKNEFTKHI